MRKVLKLQNSNNEMVDLSEFVIDARLSTRGSGGLTDGELYIIFRPDPTVLSCLSDVYNSDQAVAYEYGPAGSGKGQPKHTGQCLLQAFTPNEATLIQTGTQQQDLY